jgi:hypothetical protein
MLGVPSHLGEPGTHSAPCRDVSAVERREQRQQIEHVAGVVLNAAAERRMSAIGHQCKCTVRVMLRPLLVLYRTDLR